MIAGKPSETALHTAAARAAHHRFDPEPHLLEDTAAADLLGPGAEGLMKLYQDDGPWVLVENRIFVPLRTRYVEDRLHIAHREGARQYVVLGAGLDSFAFRQPMALQDIEVFEIDHPSTQSWKMARIEELGWIVPENVHFIECDFEKGPVSVALRETEFDPSVRSVLCWMGVVYYLTKETVANTLADLATLLADGSEVVLDYMRPWEELSPRYLELRDTMAKYLDGAGEPQISRYRRDELLRVIHDAGYAHAHTEDRQSLFERYIRPIHSAVPLSERFGLAVATR
ncbi:MAG: SAM-dependent methyltransferase [Deltaproteobacteria bacterium]|jgi:methyltransferase (TIGR00027 family)|nr:SAM-dependent methyltransferase [Deltaproteobacteria bacterium]